MRNGRLPTSRKRHRLRSNKGFFAILFGPRMGPHQNIRAENHGNDIFVCVDGIRNLSVKVDHHSGYIGFELTNTNAATGGKSLGINFCSMRSSTPGKSSTNRSG